LESLDFKLVKKALREREMLIKAAPHRVWPLRFGIPVFNDSRLNSIRLKFGLMLYDFLAGTLNSGQVHRYFSRAGFAEHFPCLNSALSKGGFTYVDAQTDDARLVLELIDGALSAGAVCLNYCKVTGFIEDAGQLCGAKIQNRVDGEIAEVYARQIVNATGQWNTESASRLTKGVHLILPKVLGNEALLLTAKADGRVFFMIPWYGLTLLGTTDTDYAGDVDQVYVNEDEVDYLLTEINRVLDVNWTEADIIGRYAGLRVLKQSSEAKPSSVSRDWELKIESNGLLISIGGKITSAREDAAHIVNMLCRNLGINEQCSTEGRPFPWLPEQDYRLWSDAALVEAAALGIDKESAEWLIRRQAKRVPLIFLLIKRNASMAKRITPTLPFIFAELQFCAGNEMVVYLEDLVRRRIPLLILAKMTQSELRYLAEIMAKTLDWDELTLAKNLEVCITKYDL
jgi:glycerol-3-phosphate dehydrogenase